MGLPRRALRWLGQIWPELAIIGLAVALATLTAIRTSPTADESKHILDALSLQQRGVAIHEETPSALLHVLFVDTSHLAVPAFDTIEPFGPISWQAIYDPPNRSQGEAVKVGSRVPTVIVFAALLVLVAMWSRQLLGGATGAARLALALCAWNPTMIAHASVATADLFITTATLAAAFALWHFLANPRARTAAWLGVAVGACLLAKISGVFIVATVVAIVVAWAIRGRAAHRDAGRGLGRRLAFVAIVVAAPILIVDAAYGFAGVGKPLAASPHEAPLLQHLAASPLGRVALPVPAEYVRAIDYSLADGDRRLAADITFSLLGTSYRHHRWSYFPLAFLLKMPLALLVLLGAGGWRLARDRARAPGLAPALVSIPLVFLVANILLNPFDVGVRYILPVVPFAALIAGFAVPASGRLRSWLPRVVLPILLWGAVAPFPDYLGTFNASAWFTPRERLLGDSNLEWGQLDYLIADDLRAHPTGAVCLDLVAPVIDDLGPVERGRGLRPCRYYVSRSIPDHRISQLIRQIFGPPLRSLGGVIDVYDVTTEADLRVEFLDDWELADPPSAAAPGAAASFHPVHVSFGRVAPVITPTPEGNACVTVRSPAALDGMVEIATVDGQDRDDTLLPFVATRVSGDQPYSVLLCGPGTWLQVFRIPSGPKTKTPP